jgi:hypothetical protein
MANNGAAMAGQNQGNNAGNNRGPVQNANNANGVNNNGAAGLDGLSQFTTTFGQFIAQLQKLNLPPVINIEGKHEVVVTINGASAFQGMQESVQKLIVSEVNKSMSKLSAANEGAISVG